MLIVKMDRTLIVLGYEGGNDGDVENNSQCA